MTIFHRYHKNSSTTCAKKAKKTRKNYSDIMDRNKFDNICMNSICLSVYIQQCCFANQLNQNSSNGNMEFSKSLRFFLRARVRELFKLFQKNCVYITFSYFFLLKKIQYRETLKRRERGKHWQPVPSDWNYYFIISCCINYYKIIFLAVVFLLFCSLIRYWWISLRYRDFFSIRC